jgi:membrane protein
MGNTPSELERAEARVAESAARVVGHIQTLKATVRQRGSSPLVIGALIAAVAAVGYVAFRRSSRLKVCPPPAPQDKLVSALKTVRLLAPWLGAVGSAVEIFQRGQCASAPITALPQSAAQPHAALASKADLLQGSWFNQHRHMIAAAAQAWVDDYAASMGAALSYYTLFSLAPLLIIVIAVAGMVFGQDAAQGEIVAQLRGIMGADGAMAVEGMLKAAREPATSVVATVVGVALLLLGATAIFAELQDALDRIWRVPAPRAHSGIWYLLRTRLLSFGLVLGLGFMLVVSLVMSAALAALGKWWGGWFEGWHVFLEVLNFAVSFGMTRAC